jgi:hypothetical protein
MAISRGPHERDCERDQNNHRVQTVERLRYINNKSVLFTCLTEHFSTAALLRAAKRPDCGHKQTCIAPALVIPECEEYDQHGKATRSTVAAVGCRTDAPCHVYSALGLA